MDRCDRKVESSDIFAGRNSGVDHPRRLRSLHHGNDISEGIGDRKAAAYRIFPGSPCASLEQRTRTPTRSQPVNGEMFLPILLEQVKANVEILVMIIRHPLTYITIVLVAGQD